MRRRVLLPAAAVVLAAAGLVVPAPARPAATQAVSTSGPSVIAVSPRHGKLAGGTRVKVIGTGFTRVQKVMFGTALGTRITVAGRTTLYVTSPKHAAGRVHVRVVTSHGTSAAHFADRFTYARAPQVVLDPGHNGSYSARINRLVYAGYGRYKPCNTTGTATNAGYPEHRFNWRVALLVRRILVARGIKVILTRSSDTGVGPCVNRRAAIESTPGTACAVAIHADGAPSAGHGFHVNEDSRRPEHATRATVKRSRRLSRLIHTALAGGSGLVPSTYIGRNGYYFRDDLAGLNLATSPTTFLELGNMRNAHDAHLQSTPKGRHRIARAVAKGILAFLGW